MKDVTTNDRLEVLSEGTAGPYLTVPVSQLDEICKLLNLHGVYFYVDDTAISVNGEPEFTIIEFGQKGDAAAVQRILDQPA